MADPLKSIDANLISHDGSARAAEGSLPMLRSDQLFQGHREILITHCNEVYRLRLTRNGKLILTK